MPSRFDRKGKIMDRKRSIVITEIQMMPLDKNNFLLHGLKCFNLVIFPKGKEVESGNNIPVKVSTESSEENVDKKPANWHSMDDLQYLS